MTIDVGLLTAAVLVDVRAERERQEAIGLRKRAVGIDWRSCADPDMAGGDGMRFLVLAEEFGEVANAVLEAGYEESARTGPATTTAYQVAESDTRTSDAHLRDELVQVAAVATAWVEAIDVRQARGAR